MGCGAYPLHSTPHGFKTGARRCRALAFLMHRSRRRGRGSTPSGRFLCNLQAGPLTWPFFWGPRKTGKALLSSACPTGDGSFSTTRILGWFSTAPGRSRAILRSRGRRSARTKAPRNWVSARRDKGGMTTMRQSSRSRSASPPRRRLDLIFRAYDDGIAFRYFIPRQPSLSEIAIEEELTSSRSPVRPGRTTCRSRSAAPTSISTGTVPCGTLGPTSTRAAAAGRISGRTLCCGHRGGTHGLRRAVPRGGDGHGHAPSELAWLSDRLVKVRGVARLPPMRRVALMGTRPGALLESNVIRLLNPGASMGDTSWIRPGKVGFRVVERLLHARRAAFCARGEHPDDQAVHRLRRGIRHPLCLARWDQ